MEKLKENPLLMILTVFREMSRNANAGLYKSENSPQPPVRFRLEDLISCLLGINQDNMLTEAPLEAYLSNFSRGDGEDNQEEVPDAQLIKPVREAIREGARITFGLLPCDINGLPLAKKHFDDTKNTDYLYFHVFYSNPKKRSEMAKTWGCQEYAPYLAIIPEEFLDEGPDGCSFVVKYPPLEETNIRTSNPALDKADFQYFEGECRRIYVNLQNKIKDKR